MVEELGTASGGTEGSGSDAAGIVSVGSGVIVRAGVLLGEGSVSAAVVAVTDGSLVSVGGISVWVGGAFVAVTVDVTAIRMAGSVAAGETGEICSGGITLQALRIDTAVNNNNAQ